jgi:subtilase family serine protease
MAGRVPTGLRFQTDAPTSHLLAPAQGRHRLRVRFPKGIRGRLGIVLVLALIAALITSLSIALAYAVPDDASFIAHPIDVQPPWAQTEPLPYEQQAAQVPQVTFKCQVVSPAPTCYQPLQVRTAYHIQSLLDGGTTGRGRTIVIIDAFQDPSIRTDLAIFDRVFGIPDPVFRQVAPFGLPRFNIKDTNQVGWSAEIALDVEWAHAIAPGARIVLALARSDDDTDVYNTLRYAIDHNLGDVISQSFGEAERCVDPRLLRATHRLYQRATAKGITLIASSGDDGATQPTCNGKSFFRSVSSPAADPLITAIGGTNLAANPITGAYEDEIAWTDARLTHHSSQGFSGGGFSTIYTRPSYQANIPHTRANGRGVPDLAYNAGEDGGVLVHWGVGNRLAKALSTDPRIFYEFGGTSAGAPQWAGLVALADQLAGQRLGTLNPAFYRIGRDPALYPVAFHDPHSRGNSLHGIRGDAAATNWDPVTGLGTPKADVLVPLVARLAASRCEPSAVVGAC